MQYNLNLLLAQVFPSAGVGKLLHCRRLGFDQRRIRDYITKKIDQFKSPLAESQTAAAQRSTQNAGPFAAVGVPNLHASQLRTCIRRRPSAGIT